ncbi:MAG TPA: hypothetical protein GX517_12785, partial [Alicyclobacillus sp.]|nr:hypothetical protein [Alicyclobacillus sp.]
IVTGAAGGEGEAAGADAASSPRGAVAGAGAAPVSETAVPTGAPARDTSPGQEPEAAKVLAELHVDVTGDDFPDTVDLTGRPLMAGSPMLGDFVLTMTHGVAGTKIILPLGPKSFVGLEPVLYPVDIPGQRGSGVLVSIGNGGSGGTRSSLLVSFAEGVAREVVPREELNAGLQAKIEYLDGFKARLTEPRTGRSVTLDLRDRKTDYLRLGIFDQNGKLLKPVSGFVDGYSVFVPVRQPDGHQVFEGRQTLSGAYRSDGLAVLASTWALQDGKLELRDVRFLTVGPKGAAADPSLDNQPAPKYPVGSEFSEPGTWPPETILDSRYADMDGDGVRDSVLLLGTRRPDNGAMWWNISPAVVDGATGASHIFRLDGEDQGYSPLLWVGPLGETGQKVILASIETGGSGGTSYYSLWTVKDGLLHPVIDPAALSDGVAKKASVRFLPGFLAELRIPSVHVQWTFDVSDRKDEYIALGLYNDQGRLLKNQEGWVDPLSSLTPVDENGDGVYDALIGKQAIAGAAHVDRLGTAVSRWVLSGGQL